MAVALSTFSREGGSQHHPQSTFARRRSGYVGLCEVAAARILTELSILLQCATKARRAFVSAQFVRIDSRSDVAVTLSTFSRERGLQHHPKAHPRAAARATSDYARLH